MFKLDELKEQRWNSNKTWLNNTVLVQDVLSI